eukprot:scaffold84179_cov41-Tisochrysis_lutea.AAC.1
MRDASHQEEQVGVTIPPLLPPYETASMKATGEATAAAMTIGATSSAPMVMGVVHLNLNFSLLEQLLSCLLLEYLDTDSEYDDANYEEHDADCDENI